MPTESPDHAQVVEELQVLRRRGLVRIRALRLPGLAAIAKTACPDREEAEAIEHLLREGLARLFEGPTRDLAAITFGLKAGLRGTSPVDLRKRAAESRGVTPESWRKHVEPIVVADLAGGVLAVLTDVLHDG